MRFQFEETDFTEEQLAELAKTKDKDLVSKFPGHKRQELRIKKRQLLAGKSKYHKEDFRKYLVIGRTLNEIKNKFGNFTDDLLNETYEGYNFFHQRNEYNEPVYILLPEIKEEIQIQDKVWKYHEGKNDKGERQPYLLIEFPQKVFKDNRIRIVPIGDLHYGSACYKHEKFLSYLSWIKENEDIFVILGGDILENALDDGRGMVYEQNINPDTQINEMIKLLAPVAHRCLVSTSGNHEARTLKKAGIDPLKFICDKLKIPHYSGPVIMSLLANGYKWSFHIFHGRGNSQTKGGKLNAAGRARQFTGFINYFVSFHVHDPMTNSETVILEDPINCRLVYKQQWIIISPSFLEWENSYAYRAGYSPPGKGGVVMELFDNGDYRALLK